MKRHAMFSLLAIALMGLLLVGCNTGAEPTATPIPPTDTPVSDQPAAPEDAWARIQAAGTLVAGVSADYPPFESYDENFKLDGFDIALMKAIGQRLGVEVEFNDFAFDGLFGAMQLGQADVAISAISETQERREQVDFSDVYFISQGVALGSDQRQLDVTPTADNLQGLRVAVEGGTVYESWAHSDLIDQGLLPETNLLVYSDVEQAVKDVQRGLVDVVLMDLQPAQAFVQQGGVAILAEDVTVQRFAIAIPKGQDLLRRAINQALSQLQGEKLIFSLAEQYLNVTAADIVPVPLPTAEPPTPTAAPNQPPTAVPTVAPPPAGCIDGMAWVADLSFDDSNMTSPPVVPPGQSFVKSWRVRNSGTCTWNSSYVLGYDHGNVPAAQMGGQPIAVQGTVAPGATYDFNANLVAPTAPGAYQGFWQMRNGQGRTFGETVWVGIRVPASAPATPAPTQTPVAGITFTSTSTSIQQGQCVTISWNAVNVREVYFYQQGQNWQNNGVAGQGSRQECPQQTTTYYLRVVMQDNSVQTRELTVNVTPVSNAPQINSFTINPQGQIQAGQCVTLQWNVGGSISDIFLSRNNQPLWDGAPYQGNYQDCPPGGGQMTYLLKATGPGGSNQATQTITVVSTQPTNTPVPQPTNTPQPPPTNTPVPPTSTPVPQPPAISNFSAIPDQINLGECVTLSWSFSGQSLVTAVITRDGQPVASDISQNGSQQDCPPNAGSVTYTLKVDSEVGSTAQSAQVNVLEPQPPTAEPEQPPQITSFLADPAEIGLNNSCTTLSWSIDGTSIASVTLSRSDNNGTTALSEGDAAWPFQDCVDASLAGQTLIYTLTVDSEFSGSTSQQTTVVFAAG